MKNYYEILNIKNTASKKEIKEAYRKMAQIHHPDKNGGDHKLFYKISEAYGVLSDERSRLIYDMQIKKKVLNMEDILNNISKKFKKKRKITLDLELEEGVKTKTVRVKTSKKCKPCNGKGGEVVGECISCKGTGVSSSTYSKDLKTKDFSCLNCSGRGHMLNGICRSCNGKREVEVVEEYRVKIDISKK
jgi:DnaJ-class molecular chaperone